MILSSPPPLEQASALGAQLETLAPAHWRGVSLGGLIMIHGQQNGFGWLGFLSRRRDWAEGCIALKNNEMDIVWNLIREGTQLEILP